MSERIELTDVAKLVRKELKANFPGQKFRVKSARYAGGSSIYVNWENGVSYSSVQQAVGKYHGAEFDGMVDLKTFNDKPYANDYILCNRTITQDVIDRLIAEKTAAFDPNTSRFQIEDMVYSEMRELEL
jgi:hypothetical protein